MYKRVVTKIISILFAPIKKVIFGAIDGYTQHMMKNDPEINRLRKRSDRLTKDIEDDLIKMFGSLDKVPPGYRKMFELDSDKETDK